MTPPFVPASMCHESVQGVVLEPGGSVRYHPRWLAPETAEALFARLVVDLNWRQLPVYLFGRWIPQPRLVDFHADPGVAYIYAGLRLQGQGWPQTLKMLRDAASTAAGVGFNSVLCNLYRDGGDYMGWHADDEPELGPEPTIASISLGSERRFLLRPRQKPREPRHEWRLASGSLLLMEGKLQRHWQHQLPRALRVQDARINLTFRNILVNLQGNSSPTDCSDA
jgi:alkylated DNA repair dioxygenase AlkB